MATISTGVSAHRKVRSGDQSNLMTCYSPNRIWAWSIDFLLRGQHLAIYTAPRLSAPRDDSSDVPMPWPKPVDGPVPA